MAFDFYGIINLLYYIVLVDVGFIVFLNLMIVLCLISTITIYSIYCPLCSICRQLSTVCFQMSTFNVNIDLLIQWKLSEIELEMKKLHDKLFRMACGRFIG